MKTRKEGRGHIYIPQIKKTDYEAKTVKHVVDRVFDGTPVALVRQLLESGQLNENDLKELKNLIEKTGGHYSLILIIFALTFIHPFLPKNKVFDPAAKLMAAILIMQNPESVK